MKPSLAPAQRLPASAPRNTRKADRIPVSGAVVVRSSRGDQSVARLRDLSEYGCNIASDADWLRAGSFIAVHIGHKRTIQAVVRWVRDGAAGIEFLRPISLADSEQFGRLGD